MGDACFDDLQYVESLEAPAQRNRSLPIGLRKQTRKVRSMLVLFAFGIVLLALGSYTLRYIPIFDIATVKAAAEGGINVVPSQIATLLGELHATSLFALDPRQLERELESFAVVAKAQVKRILPSTVSVKLTMESPGMLIAAVDTADVVKGIFLVKQDEMIEMPFNDFLLFGNKVFVVQVSPAYADHLVKYGLDHGIQEVVRLANDMGIDEDGNYNLITKIKYDNNSNDNFGRMVLYLPSCNAQLWIREPVSVSRLHEAVRLIESEHDRDRTRNIALKGELRYDLYANSLVSRQ